MCVFFECRPFKMGYLHHQFRGSLYNQFVQLPRRPVTSIVSGPRKIVPFRFAFVSFFVLLPRFSHFLCHQPKGNRVDLSSAIHIFFSLFPPMQHPIHRHLAICISLVFCFLFFFFVFSFDAVYHLAQFAAANCLTLTCILSQKYLLVFFIY